ncbi:uncharacterized protein [Rutidosis leptorrhynchoides]|uniref:uncharacterized protein n=1 Tax=Rutidosis leptorrhynchoides TaxID=125765 RepID=UPI003A9A0673
MGKSMMFAMNVPRKFWPEACNTTSYIQNRLQTKSLKGITPFEMLFGAKPKVSHLKVFGCVAYTHISEKKRQKMSEKVIKGVMMGYSSNASGYKIFDLVKDEMIIVRRGDNQSNNDGVLESPESGGAPESNGSSSSDPGTQETNIDTTTPEDMQPKKTYAPVARLDTVRLLIALAANKGWKIHQMDVKSDFLNEKLEEEVYIKKSEGFIIPG